jgi:hypothetical protein
MSYLLPHLNSGFAVDQAILGEEDRVIVLRRVGIQWAKRVHAANANKRWWHCLQWREFPTMPAEV